MWVMHYVNHCTRHYPAVQHSTAESSVLIGQKFTLDSSVGDNSNLSSILIHSLGHIIVSIVTVHSGNCIADARNHL